MINSTMIYSPKIQKAINFATKVHIKQNRKGKTLPYIIHPFGIAVFLARVGAEEDVICAGILHDTIEDCEPPNSVTVDDIEKEFGKRVARIVNDVTEQDKSLPWIERKKLALEHVEKMQYDSILVKSADVLQNMTDQIEDYKIEGDEMFKRFNSTKEQQLDRYNKLITELGKYSKQNPLIEDLTEQLAILNDLWK